MKITRLTICDWHGQGKTDTVIEHPSWPDIEAAIRALNNQNLNDIHLEIEGQPEKFLTVGGGDGKYIVSGSINATAFPTLVDLSVQEEPHVNLIVGGQLADFPAQYVVDLDRALTAARSVAETGNFAEKIGWTYV